MADNFLSGASVRHGSSSKELGQEINPTVMIGLGGTGKNILLMLRRKFFDRFGDLDNFPLVSYAFIDTDKSMRTPLTMDSDIPRRIEPRPEEKVEATVPDPTVYTRNLDQYPHIRRWFSPALTGMFPIHEGAGGIRQKSRLAFYHNFDKIEKVLLDAKGRATNPEKTRQVAEKLNVRAGNTVQFFIFSSLAGGTGSGCFLDVAFLIKELFPESRCVGYLVTADIFGQGDGYLRPNTYAALRELEHFSFSSDFDYQWKRGRPSRALPMHVFEHCFIIGNQNRHRQYPPGLVGMRSLFDMIAEAVFQEFGMSDFAAVRRGLRVNLMSDLEKAFHLTDTQYGQKLISDAKKDQFPEIYATFGLAILRVPLDRIKRCCAYKMSGEIVRFWQRGGGGPTGQVQLREFVKNEVLSALELLEEKKEKGRNDLLKRLYKDPKSGEDFMHEVNTWARNLSQYFNAQDLRPTLEREIEKFRTTKFAEGGHFVKQMADNRDAIIEKLDKDLSVKMQDLINKKGLAAVADQLLKEIIALIDDPQEAYLPHIEKQLMSLEQHEKAYKAQYEAALAELIEVATWKNPLKWPFQAEAKGLVGETFLDAVKNYFTARIRTVSRAMARDVLLHFKKVAGSAHAPRHFVEFLDRLYEYLERMQDAYSKAEELLQVQDLYKPDDVENKYYPMLFGAAGSKERTQHVESVSKRVLDILKQNHPTIFDVPQPLRLLELQGERDIREIGDELSEALNEFVGKLDDKVHIAREMNERNVSAAVITELAQLADPWLKPEAGLPVDYRLDPGLTKFLIAGKDDEQRLWQSKYLQQIKSEVASIHTGSAAVTPGGDGSQIIIYSERARFPLFYADILERYKQEYHEFQRRQPDWPLHIDVSLRGLREISLPTRQERERERQVRRAMFLTRIFKKGLRTERTKEADGTLRTALFFEFHREGARYSGVKEVVPLGPDPETAIRHLLFHDEAREAMMKLADDTLNATINGERWAELRALFYWYKENHFQPEQVEAVDAGNLTSRQTACLPERIIIEKDLESLFDARIRKIEATDGANIEKLSRFTREVQEDVEKFPFSRPDDTQQDFVKAGRKWRAWVDEAAPSVSFTGA